MPLLYVGLPLAIAMGPQQPGLPFCDPKAVGGMLGHVRAKEDMRFHLSQLHFFSSAACSSVGPLGATARLVGLFCATGGSSPLLREFDLQKGCKQECKMCLS